ncbi:MAG: 1-deoxy-D-xylulose-5-phosphate synthase [Bacteroidales bacterium]|nr:1-deoxy-D-xylulose-5-phosphate synthase [Bacteroidales bacterium]MBO5075966.1 1-deoxy-D-xylulose-5-phosphate synthase [Bacteroidales bacterium]
MENTTYNILDKVDSPKDIKGLSIGELRELCAEIRSYMIECCSINPGHLGSSLGAVELIVGLHYVYDAPQDKLVFDVGHQAYAHKIITGRREAFRKNRMKDGISGFPKRSESEYDAFGAGHSSTSISAALGFAEAAKQQKLGHKAVALIGDGSLTGGLAFEGLNNAGAAKTDILVILNDNNISIDRNIGAIHEYLLNITTDPRYNKAKKHIWDKLGDGRFRKLIQKMVVGTKSYLVRHSGGDLFEAMGFRYFGPIDGNDIEQVIRTLQKLKELGGPLILHTLTTKGKGYAPAEANQTVWHAPGIFDPETGERIKSEKGESRYQDVFGATLLELAKMNPKVVGITPAMASGCGMNILAKEMPDRFYDVGIEEEHAVTFSAGLAAGGMKPFCNIYSSFSQRALDQIIHDVALQNLPVVLCLDRGGIVGEDGATHHGCYDMALYRTIPGAIIAAPKDEIELKNMMYSAMLSEDGPYIIRYPRGYGEGTGWQTSEFEEYAAGKGEKLKDGEDIAVIAAGPFANRAVEAAEIVKEKTGRCPAIYNIRYIKPVDEDMLEEICGKFDEIITIEDGCITGGLYGCVAEYTAQRDKGISITPIAIPDSYLSQGTQEELRDECGLTTRRIAETIEGKMKKISKKDRKVLEI